ncbi:MAG: hypothetical protein L0312_32275, partial [Acidobacteria bacterium]|nr:hypothetical protein [Acidobacteriota bacterium]
AQSRAVILLKFLVSPAGNARRGVPCSSFRNRYGEWHGACSRRHFPSWPDCGSLSNPPDCDLNSLVLNFEITVTYFLPIG